MSPLHWTDPERSFPLASLERPDRRNNDAPDRRADPQRGADGDRRKASRRTLRSLLRL